MLVRLLYASRAVNTSAELLEAIVEHAKLRNIRRGITGVLCFGNGTYMQLIEGERSTVNELYSKMITDPRHKDLTLLAYEEIEERFYGKWTMGQVNMTPIHQATLLRFSGFPELNPFTLSGKTAFILLDELVATS